MIRIAAKTRLNSLLWPCLGLACLVAPTAAQEVASSSPTIATSAAVALSTAPTLTTGHNDKGKVMALYPEGSSLTMVIEAVEPLVAGQTVYIGDKELPATLEALLNKTEKRFYYSATTGAKAPIETGDVVRVERFKTARQKSALQVMIERNYTFEPKHQGQITAVQAGRAMIDRGTLHEVRERDIYRITDAGGRYRGYLEIRGIGDLQSSGVLYNPVEDFSKRALDTERGDRVKFIGQRKLFALGMQGGVGLDGRKDFERIETVAGGGLIWNLMFRDGWGLEILFGMYLREFDGVAGFRDNTPGNQFSITWSNNNSTRFIAPVWIKKNFFFPRAVSPFLAAGLSLMQAKNEYVAQQLGNGGTIPSFEYRNSISKTTVAPVLGAGVEFFPARLIRPRLEVRYFGGHTLTAGDNVYNTESLFYSLGFFMGW